MGILWKLKMILDTYTQENSSQGQVLGTQVNNVLEGIQWSPSMLQ